MKKILKDRDKNIRSLITLPSLHKKRLLRVYQNANAKSKQNSERKDDFITFILLVMVTRILIRLPV